MSGAEDTLVSQHPGGDPRAAKLAELAESTPAEQKVSPLVRLLAQYWTIVVLIAIIAAFDIADSSFLSRLNWLSTSIYSTEILPLAVGELFVIASAGIDLSVGSVLGLSAMSGALVMQDLMGHMTSWLIMAIGFAVCLATGAISGAVNGFLITRAKLTPFIVTLGMLGIGAGLTNVISGGIEVSNLPGGVGRFGIYTIGNWLSLPVIIALAVAVIAGIVLARTRAGLRTYAIGSNRESARRAGILVDRHTFWLYIFSGLMAGLAGLLTLGRLSAATTSAGAGDELNAIAAVVIGGASLFGGSGTVLGAVVGTAIISCLVTGLTLSGVQPFWQQVATGAIVIAAVYIDQMRTRFTGSRASA
jgi:ribose transport system permease protein